MLRRLYYSLTVLLCITSTNLILNHFCGFSINTTLVAFVAVISGKCIYSFIQKELLSKHFIFLVISGALLLNTLITMCLNLTNTENTELLFLINRVSAFGAVISFLYYCTLRYLEKCSVTNHDEECKSI